MRTASTKKRSIARRLGFVCLTISMLSVGCGSLGQVIRHKAIRGQDIDPKLAGEIVPGTTTRQEVVAKFGEPGRKTPNPDGTEEYLYTYSGVVEETNEKIIWAHSQQKDENKTLRVVFSGEVVTGVAYTNSAEPKENLSRMAGTSEVVVKTIEGHVDFVNDPNQLKLDVTGGLAAKVAIAPNGTLAVGLPADNKSPLRMRVRSRFASANPGTEFITSANADETDVAVKTGKVVVRSRTGCEIVDAGDHKVIQAKGSEAAATIKEIQFPTIHYGFRLTTPVGDDAPLVDCAGDLLSDYPAARVRIEGHSDSVGTPEFNMQLSKRRAEEVRRALIANGVAASRLEAKWYGKSKPVAPNDTEPGRAQNRRVEFTLLGKP